MLQLGNEDEEQESDYIRQGRELGKGVAEGQ